MSGATIALSREVPAQEVEAKHDQWPRCEGLTRTSGTCHQPLHGVPIGTYFQNKQRRLHPDVDRAVGVRLAWGRRMPVQ